MKYFIRSIKSFISVAAVFFVVLVILIFTTDGASFATAFDPEVGLFRANSQYKILAFFLAFAAIYPAVTYVKKEVFIAGSFMDHKETIEQVFNAAGYEFETADDEIVSFRKSNKVARFMRLYEDRITISKGESPLILNGHRKDILRVASSLQYALRNTEEE